MELKWVKIEEEEEENQVLSTEILPSDAIYEILTRVALETILHQCRFVCKDWQTLTYNSNFKHLHSQRTQTVSGYFLQSEEKCNYCTSFVSMIDHTPPPIPSQFLNFLSKDVAIVASSPQGLICCVSSESSRISYYICKPTTREWIKIPNPKTRYFTERVAMVVKQSNPLYYKIIRFSWPKKATGYCCEIFDSCKWAWKMLSNVNLPQQAILAQGSGILVNGAFHWLTTQNQIFAFHIDQESWRTMELPEDKVDMNCDFFVYKKLVECDGRIALFYANLELVELWIMEDYLKETWKKMYDVNLLSLYKDVGVCSLLDLYTSEIMMLEGYNKVIWYNTKTDTYTASKVPHRATIRQVHAFQSDSVPCNMK